MPEFVIKISTPADLSGAAATLSALDQIEEATGKATSATGALAAAAARTPNAPLHALADAASKAAANSQAARRTMSDVARESDEFLSRLALGIGIGAGGTVIEGVEEIGRAFAERKRQNADHIAPERRPGSGRHASMIRGASDPDLGGGLHTGHLTSGGLSSGGLGGSLFGSTSAADALAALPGVNFDQPNTPAHGLSPIAGSFLAATAPKTGLAGVSGAGDGLSSAAQGAERAGSEAASEAAKAAGAISSLGAVFGQIAQSLRKIETDVTNLKSQVANRS